jgi:hypothetical protein
MTDIERLAAIEELRQLKARYFRAVDSADSALMATVLADDCVLDYRGCCTDPATGIDHLPAMNVVIRRNGGEILAMDALARAGIVSVHQGHMFEVEFDGDDRATGIWSMTDRLYMRGRVCADGRLWPLS